MILEDYRTRFKQQLEVLYPPEEITAITDLALQFVLQRSRVEIALSRKQELTPSQITALDGIIVRLLQSEPIAYIMGTSEFYGLELQVNNATLIPRPETEELVSWILSETANKNPRHILDIGTGSGCIAIALAKNLPQTVVEAIDISVAALEIAQSNAQHHDTRVRFYQQNILQVSSLQHKYDVIVSNPPYVRTLEKAEIQDNVLNHEPHTALFVEDKDPLVFYKKITELALEYLNPGGQLFFEINEYLGEETEAIVNSLGFSTVILKKDLFGKDRMIRAFNTVLD